MHMCTHVYVHICIHMYMCLYTYEPDDAYYSATARPSTPNVRTLIATRTVTITTPTVTITHAGPLSLYTRRPFYNWALRSLNPEPEPSFEAPQSATLSDIGLWPMAVRIHIHQFGLSARVGVPKGV